LIVSGFPLPAGSPGAVSSLYLKVSLPFPEGGP